MKIRSWTEVRRLALAYRARLADSLITARIADVPAIQCEILALDRIVAWFEEGPEEDRMVGDVDPPPGY